MPPETKVPPRHRAAIRLIRVLIILMIVGVPAALALKSVKGRAVWLYPTGRAGSCNFGQSLEAAELGYRQFMESQAIYKRAKIIERDPSGFNRVDTRVDFIKMDIEGAEPNAVRGARETIGRFKPRMALCLYHRAHDPIQIPKEVRAIVPEYLFSVQGNMFSDRITAEVGHFRVP